MMGSLPPILAAAAAAPGKSRIATRSVCAYFKRIITTIITNTVGRAQNSTPE
jgi:hypothetical protein